MILWLDVLAMLAAFASSLLWFKASGKSLRRVYKGEALDEHDLNRIVTAFNRNQILNGRAALATAVPAGREVGRIGSAVVAASGIPGWSL